MDNNVVSNQSPSSSDDQMAEKENRNNGCHDSVEHSTTAHSTTTPATAEKDKRNASSPTKQLSAKSRIVRETQHYFENKRLSGGFNQFWPTCTDQDLIQARGHIRPDQIDRREARASDVLRILRTLYNCLDAQKKRTFEWQARIAAIDRSIEQPDEQGDSFPTMPLIEEQFTDLETFQRKCRFSRLMERRLSCPHCPTSKPVFRLAKDYFIHFAKDHQCVDLHACHYCCTGFGTRELWSEHMRSCPKRGKDAPYTECTREKLHSYQLLVCTDCGAHTSLNAGAIDRTKRNPHQEWRELLTFHAHHNSADLAAVRVYCHKALPGDVTLDVIPSFVKAFRISCDDCNIDAFRDVDECLEHFKTKHPKVKRYACRKCKEVFMDEGTHRLHVLSHLVKYSTSAYCLADYVKSSLAALRIPADDVRKAAAAHEKIRQVKQTAQEKETLKVKTQESMIKVEKTNRTLHKAERARISTQLVKKISRLQNENVLPPDIDFSSNGYTYTAESFDVEDENIATQLNGVTSHLEGFPGGNLEVLYNGFTASLMEAVTVKCTIQLKNKARSQVNPRSKGLQNWMFYCPRCKTILEGELITRNHLAKCCRDAVVDKDGKLLFDPTDNDLVICLSRPSRQPDERLLCPLPECESTSCSVIGQRAHLAAVHGILTGISTEPREYPKSIEMKPNEVVRYINEQCGLTADGKVPTESALQEKRGTSSLSSAEPLAKKAKIVHGWGPMPAKRTGHDGKCLGAPAEEMCWSHISYGYVTDKETASPWYPQRNETMPLICPFCDLRVRGVNNMRSHLQYHPERKTVCYLCHPMATLESFKDLRVHLREKHCTFYHTDTGDGYYLCHFCDDVLARGDIVRHLVHNCPKSFCGICPQVYTYSIENERPFHRDGEHANIVKRFQCTACDAFFPGYTAYVSHVCKQMIMKCECDMKFDSNEAAHDHFVTKHSSDEKCIWCRKAVDHSTHFETHMTPIVMKPRGLKPFHKNLEPLLKNVVVDSIIGGDLRDALMLLFSGDTEQFFEDTDEATAEQDDDLLVVEDDDIMVLNASVNAPPDEKAQDTPSVEGRMSADVNMDIEMDATNTFNDAVPSAPLPIPVEFTLDESPEKDSRSAIATPATATKRGRGRPPSTSAKNKEAVASQNACEVVTIDDDDIVEVPVPAAVGTKKPKKEATYACHLCRARFDAIPTLLEHQKNHEKIPLCDKIYGIPLHRMVYLCAECCAAFADHAQFQKHISAHEAINGKQDYKYCLSCSCYMLPNSSEGQSHTKMHDISDISYTCLHCPNSPRFKEEGQLMYHLEHSHMVDIFYFCKACNIGSTNIENVWNHIKQCTGLKENTRSCEVMGTVCASQLHYQPGRKDSDEDYEQYPDLYASASLCTHRSMLPLGPRITTCRKQEESCFGMMNGNLTPMTMEQIMGDDAPSIYARLHELAPVLAPEHNIQPNRHHHNKENEQSGLESLQDEPLQMPPLERAPAGEGTSRQKLKHHVQPIQQHHDEEMEPFGSASLQEEPVNDMPNLERTPASEERILRKRKRPQKDLLHYFNKPQHVDDDDYIEILSPPPKNAAREDRRTDPRVDAVVDVKPATTTDAADTHSGSQQIIQAVPLEEPVEEADLDKADEATDLDLTDAGVHLEEPAEENDFDKTDEAIQPDEATEAVHPEEPSEDVDLDKTDEAFQLDVIAESVNVDEPAVQQNVSHATEHPEQNLQTSALEADDFDRRLMDAREIIAHEAVPEIVPQLPSSSEDQQKRTESVIQKHPAEGGEVQPNRTTCELRKLLDHVSPAPMTDASRHPLVPPNTLQQPYMGYINMPHPVYIHLQNGQPTQVSLPGTHHGAAMFPLQPGFPHVQQQTPYNVQFAQTIAPAHQTHPPTEGSMDIMIKRIQHELMQQQHQMQAGFRQSAMRQQPFHQPEQSFPCYSGGPGALFPVRQVKPQAMRSQPTPPIATPSLDDAAPTQIYPGFTRTSQNQEILMFKEDCWFCFKAITQSETWPIPSRELPEWIAALVLHFPRAHAKFVEETEQLRLNELNQFCVNCCKNHIGVIKFRLRNVDVKSTLDGLSRWRMLNGHSPQEQRQQLSTRAESTAQLPHPIIQCAECDEQFFDAVGAVFHFITHHYRALLTKRNIPIWINCTDVNCKSSSFSTAIELRTHVQEKHRTVVHPEKVCQFGFLGQEGLCAPGSRDGLECWLLCNINPPYAQQTAVTKKRMADYIMQHYMRLKRRCTICDFVTGNGKIETLVEHFMENHTKTDSESVCCAKCGIMESSDSEWKAHVTTKHMITIMRAEPLLTHCHHQRQLPPSTS